MTSRAGRRVPAEFTGTALLVAVVVGSGIAATRLTGDGALRLLASSLAAAPAPAPAVREDRAAQLTG